MKKRVITLTGLPGAGKSSTADRVAGMLGYRRFSSGDFMRAIAKKHGVSLDEINLMAESDTTYDHEVDEMVRETGTQENIVIDSRLAFHWIPDSFKVFLKVDPRAAAERTFAHIREVGRSQQTADSVDEVYQKLLRRIESENKRYLDLYGVTYSDEGRYDLVIDTGAFSLEQVAAQIVSAYNNWLES